MRHGDTERELQQHLQGPQPLTIRCKAQSESSRHSVPIYINVQWNMRNNFCFS